MITIRDVAKEAGVSIATVSRILNGKGNHNSEVVKRVMEAAEKLNYAININAKRLKTGIKNTIGVFMPEYFLKIYPDMLKTFITEISSKNFYPEVNLNLSLEQCHYLLKSGRYDGIIIVEPIIDNKVLSKLIKEDFHIVFFGGDIEREDINLVNIDYFQAGYQATKLLIKARHNNIIFAYSNDELNITREIKRGYLFAHDEYGIQYREENIIDKYDLLNNKIEITESFNNATSALCMDHEIAQITAKILYGMKKEIPADFSLVMCGDSQTPVYIYPDLTTVVIPITQAVSIAAEILIDEIKNRDRVVKQIKLMVDIKEGKSILKRLTKN